MKKFTLEYHADHSSLDAYEFTVALGNDNGTLFITQAHTPGFRDQIPSAPFQDSSRDSVEVEYDEDYLNEIDPLDCLRGDTLLEAIEESINIEWQQA